MRRTQSCVVKPWVRSSAHHRDRDVLVNRDRDAAARRPKDVTVTGRPALLKEVPISQGFVVCVFVTAGPITQLFAWGEGNSGGHVLRETTSRGLCGLVCPSRTGERGGEGDCVKEGVEGEGERKRERALGLLLGYIPRH